MRRILVSLLSLALIAGTASADEVRSLSSRHSLLVGHQGRLEQLLGAQVKRISRLKAQPPGVRRDFQLRRALRANQQLATKLTRLQDQIRQLNHKLLSAYDRAIARTKDRPTLRVLRIKRDELARKLTVKRARAKIVTQEEASELDSAEDLEEKADLLKDSEAKVRRQLRRIQLQIKRLERRARLKRHSRAADSSLFVEDSPRRLARARSRAKSSTTTTHEAETAKRADDDGADLNSAYTATDSPPAPQEPSAMPPAAGGKANSAGESAPGTTPSPAPSTGFASPSRSTTSDSELSVTIRGVLDPSLLRELRQAKKSGDLKKRLAALAKARRKLQAMANRLGTQAKKLRARAKQRR